MTSDQELEAISGHIGRTFGARFMDPPDGGDVTLAEQVKRMCERLKALEALPASGVTAKLLLEWADDFAEAAKKFERLEKCVLLTRAQECRDAAAASFASDATPAPTSGSEDEKPGAGMSEMAEIARVVSECRHGPMLSSEALRQIAALAKPAAATGIELAARFVEKRRDDYVQEHGNYDPSTGVTEFPGTGDEYVGELEEIIEGIRSLSAHPAPATVESDGLSRNDICRLWQDAAINRPNLTVEGFTNLLLCEIDDRAALAPATEGRKS